MTSTVLYPCQLSAEQSVKDSEVIRRHVEQPILDVFPKSESKVTVPNVKLSTGVKSISNVSFCIALTVPPSVLPK